MLLHFDLITRTVERKTLIPRIPNILFGHYDNPALHCLANFIFADGIIILRYIQFAIQLRYTLGESGESFTTLDTPTGVAGTNSILCPHPLSV